MTSSLLLSSLMIHGRHGRGLISTAIALLLLLLFSYMCSNFGTVESWQPSHDGITINTFRHRDHRHLHRQLLQHQEIGQHRFHNYRRHLLETSSTVSRSCLSVKGAAQGNIDSNRHTSSSCWSAAKTVAAVFRVSRKLLIAFCIISIIGPGKAAWASSSVVASTAAATTVASAAPTTVAASTTTTATALLAAVSCPVSVMTEIKLSMRLLYAALLGAALGKERSFAKHSAGVRTMALVSMGAAAFTVCSSYGFANFIEVGCRCDPSRMAANVISGVGFVGAGVITTTAHQRQNVVHGLTTAATIWLSAAVGVACGVGLSRIATTAAITTLVILRLGRKKQINRQHNQNQDAAMLSSSPGLQVIVGAEDHLDEDEVLDQTEHHEANNADDIDSEIHLTGVWDEHHHSISSSPEQQFEDTAEQQQRRGRQHEQVMGRDPHTTYADNLWHAQQKSNLQNQERRKRKQPKEQEDTKYDNIQELVIDETEDFNAYPPQLLDAAGTYQVYKLDSTSYDFGYVNEQSGRKKVIHSARTDNRQDYQP